MRVAVTGASGFVGGAVVDRLLRAGHEVLALSRRPVAARDGLEHRRWDLATGPLDAPPAVDAVVHGAAHVDEWDRWPAHEAVTVRGTRAVLDSWPGVGVVLVSSCSVYPLRAPRAPRHVLTEEVPVTRRPLAPYVRAKIAQERLVLDRGRSIVLRPHAVHGTGDPTLLPRLERARRRGRLVCPGSAGTWVHLTDVRLVADATLAAVVALAGPTADRPRSLVNVADAAPLRLQTVAEAVRRANGWVERPLYTGSTVAWAAAVVLEGTARAVWSRRPPLLTAYGVSHLAVDRVFDTGRLRERLGIEPAPSDLTRWHPARPPDSHG